ncbi:MAG: ferritin-like domain-containing protein [Dokdonella sp.]
MSFLKPALLPIRLCDFPMQNISELAADEELMAILKTTALVESRADRYAEYLHAVFRDRDGRWREAIEQWNAEERRHGELLRKLVVAADPGFDFDAAMHVYEAKVSYHACDGKSVRGSIAGELVARCVVEALASTFYRALNESHATTNPSAATAALAALARDEARHYGMFVAMLREEQKSPNALGRWKRCWTGLRRMTELGDQQIIGAYVAVHAETINLEPKWMASRRYAAALYPRYRTAHLLFASRLICPVLFGRSDSLTITLFAIALRSGVWIKGVSARTQLWVMSRWMSAASRAKSPAFESTGSRSPTATPSM